METNAQSHPSLQPLDGRPKCVARMRAIVVVCEDLARVAICELTFFLPLGRLRRAAVGASSF
jgi:hypothetical protein